MNRITKYAGMYDEDLKTELYIVKEEAISTDTFEKIDNTIGEYGPGFQIVKTSATTAKIKFDNKDAVEAYIKKKYKEITGEDIVIFS